MLTMFHAEVIHIHPIQLFPVTWTNLQRSGALSTCGEGLLIHVDLYTPNWYICSQIHIIQSRHDARPFALTTDDATEHRFPDLVLFSQGIVQQPHMKQIGEALQHVIAHAAWKQGCTKHFSIDILWDKIVSNQHQDIYIYIHQNTLVAFRFYK